jgi:YVTN family beta-propeller protein
MRSVLHGIVLSVGVASCGSHGGDASHGGDTTTSAPESTSIPVVTGDAVYVVNGEDSSISVLDLTGKALGTIALKNVTYPHHIYLSPDKTRLAVAVPGHDLSGGHSAPSISTGTEHAGGEHGASTAPRGAVLLLDAATGATIKARRLDAANHNAIFSPGGNEIWTAQLIDEGTVLVLDANTLDTKQTVRVGRVPAEVTFSPDGKYAFVANGTSNDVTVIDASTKAVVKTIPVDREPVGAWPGADGMMYVDCEVAKTVKAIDPKTLEIVRTYALGFTPGYAAVPPSRTDELWLTDTDAGKIVFNKTAADTRVADVPTAAGAHALAFTPDGNTAFVTNQLGGSVSVVDAATRAVRATVPVGKKPNGIIVRAR